MFNFKKTIAMFFILILITIAFFRTASAIQSNTISFTPKNFPAEAAVYDGYTDITFNMLVTTTSPTALSGAELGWYQDGVRRADKGVSYLYEDYQNVELRFDVVEIEDAGEWTLRAYLDGEFAQSQVMNLVVEALEPFEPLMPLDGAIPIEVSDAAELAMAWDTPGNITIMLRDSFTMTNYLRIENGRHVTIISDDEGVERVLTAAANNRHFWVNDGGMLVLGVQTTEESPVPAYNNLRLSGGVAPSDSNHGGSVAVGHTSTGNGLFVMYGGTISGNSAASSSASSGGGVYIFNSSHFEMHGGLITGNSATAGGGGVSFQESTGTVRSTSFVMNGGAIAHNTVTGSSGVGGGVLARGNSGSFTMNGGIISHNTANQGGGVRINQNAFTFNMYGGSIYRNTADRGGGVSLDLVGSGLARSTFNMYGGTISHNRATVNTFGSTHGGGGVLVGADITFNIHDGATISHNEALNGAGVATTSTANYSSTTTPRGRTINMYGGTIAHNIATPHGTISAGGQEHLNVGGGGVQLQAANAIFNMYGGHIRDNSASHGGGVRIGHGTTPDTVFNFYGGIIERNFASNPNTGGGGIHLGRDTTLNMHGSNLHNSDGAILRNNSTRGNGGGIATNSSPTYGTTILIRGGEISGNRAYVALPQQVQGGGGGIHLQGAGSIITMEGGSIHGNHTGHNGGAVNIQQGTFVMEGGSIRNNQAFHGGGVRVHDGTFTMNGGSIHNNSTDFTFNNNRRAGRGGGVTLTHADSVFTMNGSNAEIRNNTAGTNGGGVSVNNNGASFTLASGTIRQNEAPRGGGVHVSDGLFTMNGGYLDRNTALIDGGGAWIGAGNGRNGATTGARINMTGGSIIGNSAIAGDGGGIFAHPTAMVPAPDPNVFYRNIIAASGNFSGNTAGLGLFNPPANEADFTFGNHLTNYNINYRYPVHLEVFFHLNGGNVPNNINDPIVVGPFSAGETILGTDREVPTPVREGYEFAGWRVPALEEEIDPNDENAVLEYVIWQPDEVEQHEVRDITVFIAQWSRLVHEVSYEFIGEIPVGAPAVPVSRVVAVGTPNVLPTAIEPLYFEGTNAAGVAGTWTFSGWETESAGASVDGFTMPNNSVHFTGFWTFASEGLHTVTYTVTGIAPANVTSTPTTQTHHIGTTVYVEEVPETNDTTNSAGVTGIWTFNGWYRDESLVTDTRFTMPNNNVVFTGTWTFTPEGLRVIFNPNGGILAFDSEYRDVKYGESLASNTTSATWPTNPTRPGYIFFGWNTQADGNGETFDATTTIYTNKTVYAQWIPIPPNDNGNGNNQNNNNNQNNAESPVPEGEISSIPLSRPPRANNQRTTRISAIPGDNIKEGPLGGRPQSSIYPPLPINVELRRNSYMTGYPDGTSRPFGHTTRAEMLQLFFNLSEDPNKYTIVGPTSFADLNAGAWYFNAIRYFEHMGIISGFPDGTVRPDAAITAAEFVTVAARFFNLGESLTANQLINEEHHWAASYINLALSDDWLRYFGILESFDPDVPIPRIQSIALLNFYLGRTPNPNAIHRYLQGSPVYSDIHPGTWIFYEIIEASLSRYYRINEQGEEHWIKTLGEIDIIRSRWINMSEG